MSDREIVLIQLEGVGIGLDMAGYHTDAQCVRDALALLREQDTVEHALEVLKAYGWKDSGEAVKPKSTGVEPNYNCGNCRMPIQQGYPFCPWCGKKVKWDADGTA
jgi:hypothetical protein